MTTARREVKRQRARRPGGVSGPPCRRPAAAPGSFGPPLGENFGFVRMSPRPNSSGAGGFKDHPRFSGSFVRSGCMRARRSVRLGWTAAFGFASELRTDRKRAGARVERRGSFTTCSGVRRRREEAYTTIGIFASYFQAEVAADIRPARNRTRPRQPSVGSSCVSGATAAVQITRWGEAARRKRLTSAILPCSRPRELNSTIN